MAMISWISSSGGDWSVGANWQGGVVPGAADDAVMNLTAAETITVSTTQDVHSIAMTDTAATFVIANGGALDATGDITLDVGSLSVEGAISADGMVALETGNSLAFGNAATIAATTALTLLSGGTVGAVTPVVDSGTSIASSPTFTVGTVTAAVPLADIPTGNVIVSVASNPGSFVFASGTLACFAKGTHIATPDGETRVEALAIGDCVRLARGDSASIAWIGHRIVACSRHPHPEAVRPVRIRRGAFAADMPHRDLILSPDHAVYVGGVLIPVRYLVDGRSIVQEAWEQVSYFHIELARHNVVLAEGLAVESYLETGGRDNFANGGSTVRLTPDFAPDPGFVSRLWEAKGYAPLVVTGPILLQIRETLRQRSQAGELPNSTVRRSRWRAS